MKAVRTFLQQFAIVIVVAGSQLGWAQETQKLDPKFREKFLEAAQAYNSGDLDVALKLADEAEKIQASTPAIPNLRGAVALDRGDFEKAKTEFEAALKISPKFQPAAYNLAEIPFRKKNFAEARKMFEALAGKDPKDELVKYRVFLATMLDGKRDEAQKMMDEIPFPGLTPAHYYAEAAWALQEGNKAEAEGRIRVAQSIFGGSRCRLFAEPLEYLGWLKKPELTKEDYPRAE